MTLSSPYSTSRIRAEKGTHNACKRPGAPTLGGHPKNIHLPERAVLGPVNASLGELFNPANRDATVDQMLTAAGTQTGALARREQAQRRVDKAGTELRRLHESIKAGASPTALVRPTTPGRLRRTHPGSRRKISRSPPKKSGCALCANYCPMSRILTPASRDYSMPVQAVADLDQGSQGASSSRAWAGLLGRVGSCLWSS